MNRKEVCLGDRLFRISMPLLYLLSHAWESIHKNEYLDLL